ncbi:MAG TPA: acyl-CoA dehydrogenase family protein [Baekduia sp.]|jgi:alkylation response protein AidB-like acyl-CoA dehydrogenase
MSHLLAAEPVDGLQAALADLAAGAAQRERERRHPFAEVRRLADAGLGRLRVPAAYGGDGATLRDLFATVMRVAAADSNVAQALRAHFHFVEGRLASPDEAQRRRWLPEVVAGTLFGNGTVERNTSEIFAFETTLVPDGDGFRLNGTKYYSTGTLYPDRVVVAACLPDGTVASAIVPVDRAGVHVADDWDGMGQRLTASGTTRFEDVAVAADEVVPSPIGTDAPAPRGTFLQLYLVAVAAGIVRTVATDAATVVRTRTRTFSHGSGELPQSDPLLQHIVGQIDANAFGAEAVVLAAAEALDRAVDVATQHEAAVLAARAQVIVSDLAPRSAELLFSVGGASATSREANLDRHWRNARTLASHNPAIYKARALGDLLINEQPLPTNGFF